MDNSNLIAPETYNIVNEIENMQWTKQRSHCF